MQSLGGPYRLPAADSDIEWYKEDHGVVETTGDDPTQEVFVWDSGCKKTFTNPSQRPFRSFPHPFTPVLYFLRFTPHYCPF